MDEPCRGRDGDMIFADVVRRRWDVSATATSRPPRVRLPEKAVSVN
jgi:hypothetical protein